MGLASYGTPRYLEFFKDLLRCTPDGFEVDLRYFSYMSDGLARYNHHLVEKLGEARKPESAIEERLREQRERAKRRKRVKSFLPNPRRAVRRFFEDPVTRFWCFCNICCTFCLWSGTFLFFQFLYPIWLRPIFNY